MGHMHDLTEPLYIYILFVNPTPSFHRSFTRVDSDLSASLPSLQLLSLEQASAKLTWLRRKAGHQDSPEACTTEAIIYR